MATLSRDDLIAVLRRTMDSGWLDALLADPDSAAVLNAIADSLALVSQQGQVACDDTTISLSAAGRSGTSTITLSRPATGTSGTIPQGYAFVDSRGFVAYSVGATTVGSGASTVDVLVATGRKTELANTLTDPGFTIIGNLPVTDSGLVNALISSINFPAGYPPLAATTFFTVASSTPIVGGASDWLGAIGAERGQLRQANETDASFRVRVRNVPDAVSPVAVAAAAVGAASHAGLPQPAVLEPFNLGDTPATLAGYSLDWFDCVYMSGILDSSGNAITAAPRDFMEDIQPDATNLKVREVVSLREARCYFRVSEPGPFSDVDGGRMFLDDAFLDDFVLGYPDVHDSSVLLSSLMSVWEECNRKRAAGVRFDEYVESTVRVTGKGSTTSAVESSVATMTPPVGKAWLMMDGHFGWDAPTRPTAPIFARLIFTFSDLSTFTTPYLQDPWCRRLKGVDVFGELVGFPLPTSKYIGQVSLQLASDGTTQTNLVFNMVAIEVAAP